jgi:KDO2-lipid IV(A) lauroyltransferase
MIRFFLYPLSLVPLKILYLISNFCYYLLYFIFKYRRQVVHENLKKSLPHLNSQELLRTEKHFYRNFCDNIVEILKLQSISKKELHSHIDADYSALEQLIAQNKNCHLYMGHQFNWEWANAHIASVLTTTNIIVAYKPLSSNLFNDFMMKIRNRFGSKMIAARNISKEIMQFSEKNHILVMVADQNPTIPEKSFWTTFLSQKTAFISGSELKTASQKTACFFANSIRVGRGKYKFVITPLFDFSEPYNIGLVTRLFSEHLEQAIILNPENYLWTHKRWKHKFQENFKKRWIGKPTL